MTGRTELRRYAAVVVYFDGNAISNYGDDANVAQFLSEDCHRVIGSDGVKYWALLDACRRKIAVELGRTGLRREVREKTIPWPNHPVQQAIGEWLSRSRRPDLDSLDDDRLRALQQVSMWFGTVEPRLPTVDELVTRLSAIDLYRPLHELVGQYFRGRKELLETLNDHVTSTRPEPLIFWGPGGVGKSTVVARFLLQRMESMNLAFAYLNFDRALLDPNAPRTVFIEAVRQLGLRFPDYADLASAVQSGLTDAEHLETTRSYHWIGSGAAVTQPAVGVEGELSGVHMPTFGAFASLVRAVTDDERPFVLVMDTFEEVQRVGAYAVDRVLSSMTALRNELPTLSVVVIGRSEVRNASVTNIRVGDFDRESTIGYLLARVPDLTEADLSRVLARVHPNPLSLRLAADLLNSIPDRRTALLALGRRQVQGVLYHRVLDHIADENVRRIAHPGLVLRRITPAVITNVLAKPCGITIDANRTAEDLFVALEREATLVERRDDDPGALWHRADVREIMLAALRSDDPSLIDMIHRRAVKYYRKQVGPIARAEELYHRMMLRQRPKTLLRYWSDNAAPSLRSAIDELPEEARIFLAPRIGGDVADRLDADVRANADLQTRTAQVRNRVLRMLASGRIREAYELVRTERGPHDESLAPDLEIEVREHNGDYEGAINLARRYRDRLEAAGDDRGYVASTLALSRLLDRIGHIDEAVGQLDELRELVNQLDDPTTLLQVNVALLRLSRETGADRDDLAEETVATAEQVGTYHLSREPALLRALAAEVGDRSDPVLAATMRHIGLDLTGERDMPERLAEAIESFDAEVSPQFGHVSGAILKNLTRGTSRHRLADELIDAGTRKVSRSLAQSLDDFGATPQFRTELVTFYREQDAYAHTPVVDTLRIERTT